MPRRGGAKDPSGGKTREAALPAAERVGPGGLEEAAHSDRTRDCEAVAPADSPPKGGAGPLRSARQMNLQECPRARSVRALVAVLLACLVALAASCTNPEKAKADYVRRGEAFLKERRW